MNIFNDIQKVFASGKAPSISTLEKAEAQAVRALEDARAEVEKLRATLPEAIVAGDAARRAHRDRLRQEEENVEDAASALAIVREKLAAARHEAEQAARRASYAKAAKARDEMAARLTREYPVITNQLRDLITAIARADAEVDEANAALPEGEAPLARVEDTVRDVPGIARKVVGEKIVEKWCLAGATQPAADQTGIRDEGDGRGTKIVPASGGTATARLHYDRHDFRETRFIPARPGAFGPRLHAMALPALKAGEPEAWHAMPLDASPATILAALDALAHEAKAALAPEKDVEAVEHILIAAPAQAAE